jgi:hypothetical protein
MKPVIWLAIVGEIVGRALLNFRNTRFYSVDQRGIQATYAMPTTLTVAGIVLLVSCTVVLVKRFLR